MSDFTCPRCGHEFDFQGDDHAHLLTWWGDSKKKEVYCGDCDSSFYVIERVQRWWEVVDEQD